MRLDRLDFAILERLLRNGRASFLKLAKELKVPDTTIHFRVKRLQESGVLKGFTVAVDPRGLGFPDIALIKLRIASEVMPHLTADRLEELASDFSKLEEVRFIATSVESAELLAMTATNDRRRTNEIAKQMERSGGIESIEVVRLSDVIKGHFPL
ncbi:MAG: Lrp/AsnC family transcriptional regulator [Hadesarchaea archaeon]|nr:Lrp/AsnC family transcriptional regulator [Hadesarchaea archaeon]